MQEGSRIQGYLILGEAGRGGMGVVYHARDESLDRDVAIKVLPPSVAFNADRMARFQREAKVLASLDHPNIASIYELVEDDGKVFVVMQYVDGEGLDDWTARGAMPLEDVVSIGMQIASGMAYAHDKGVIHRDLKPANVKLDADGRVKVLDFGLAKVMLEETSGSTVGSSASPSTGGSSPAPVVDPSSVSGVTMDMDTATAHGLGGMATPTKGTTMPGVMMGTVGYASPEQARGRPVDRRTDVFSLGCILFEMLSGGQPFPSETVADGIGQTLHKDPAWDSLPAGLSPRLILLLRRCLAKDRDDRLCDMGDVRLELAQLGDHDDLFEDAPSSGSGGSVVWKGLAIVSLLVAIGLGAMLATSTALESEEPAVAISEPVRHVALPVDTAFVPQFLTVTDDGGRVFAVLQRYADNEFAWGGMRSIEQTLSVRDIGERAFRPLAEFTPGVGFAVSPDGSAFVLNEGGSLSRGSVDVTSDPVRLGTVPGAVATGPNLFHSPAVRGIVWFDADRIVVEVRLDSGEPALAIVDPGSGDVLRTVPIVGIPEDIRQFGLMSRFDGDRILMSVNSEVGGAREFGLATVSITTGESKVLLMDAGDAELAGDWVFFTRHDVLHVAGYDPNTGVLVDAGEPVGGGIRTNFVSHGEIALTSNGTLLQLPGGLQREQRRLFNSEDAGDGMGSFEVGPYSGPLAVSDDGNMICVTRRLENGRTELWGGRMEQGTLRSVVSDSERMVQYYFLSPDGSKIAVGSVVDVPGGRDTIIEVGSFRADAPLKKVWSFADGGGFFPQSFHPDGDRLLGHRNHELDDGENAFGLFELDLKSGELSQVHTPPEGAVLGLWSPDADILLFQRVMDSFGMTQPKGFLFNPTTGDTVQVGELPMYDKQWIRGEDGDLGLVYWERADSPRYIPIEFDDDGEFILGREVPWDLELPDGAVSLKIDGRGVNYSVVRGENESPAGYVEMMEHWADQFDSGAK